MGVFQVNSDITVVLYDIFTYDCVVRIVNGNSLSSILNRELHDVSTNRFNADTYSFSTVYAGCITILALKGE